MCDWKILFWTACLPEHAFQKMPFLQMVAQVQHKKMCSKQSAGAKFDRMNHFIGGGTRGAVWAVAPTKYNPHDRPQS